MRGVDPASERSLRAPVAVRRIRVEQLDASTGERRRVERELRPVAGFDLVFSAPKSVSLLHALGDERVRFETSQAHQAAWQAALAYLEERPASRAAAERGRARVRLGVRRFGVRASDESGARSASAYACDRREHGAEPGWLVARARRRSPAPYAPSAAGSLYQAQLRYELTSRLGVDWQPAVKGMAEFRGVPEAVLRAFSTRRAQVVAHLAEHATRGGAPRRSPPSPRAMPRPRRSRRAPPGLGGARRRARLWPRRARGRPRTGRMARAVSGRATSRGARLLGDEGLCETRASFNEADLVAAWAAAFPRGASARRVRALASGLAHDRRVVGLDPEAPPIGVATALHDAPARRHRAPRARSRARRPRERRAHRQPRPGPPSDRRAPLRAVG